MSDAPDQLKMIGIDPREETRFLVRKRNGGHEEFNEARIFIAIESAFKAVQGLAPAQTLPAETEALIMKTTDAVAERVLSGAVKGEPLEVERIQDVVEEQLMREGHWPVARRYILYREERRRMRQMRIPSETPSPSSAHFSGTGATEIPPFKNAPPAMPQPGFQTWAAVACRGLEDRCPVEDLVKEAARLEREGEKDLEKALDLAVESRLPLDPAYDTVASRLFLGRIYREALPKWSQGEDLAAACRQGFSDYIHDGVYLGLLALELEDFDIAQLAQALRPERDGFFSGAGLRTLTEDFLLRDNGRFLETPQYYWMRLAMGLAMGEGTQTGQRAVEFYEALSTFAFVPSAPVLFNAGTMQPHLAVCYLATGWHDLEHITAQLGGRMKERQKSGLTCSWLEPWHICMPDFLARPRAGESPWKHDLNKGSWVPDLFIKRVREGGRWTLFDAQEVPDLHALYGGAFEKRYMEYEAKAERGEMKEFRQLPAVELWREMLASFTQTGQPWLAFKDAVNICSLQDHSGAVRSAQLGAGTLLNPSAGCSMGAINLAAHIDENGLDRPRLRQTVTTAMRMLDNAFDLSAYPTPALREASRAQRAAGLGITGFQEALYQLRLSYASAEAAEFADHSMEAISHQAILASTSLAKERGPCSSHATSKWSGGFLPADTLAFLEEERGLPVTVDRSARLDWAPVREAIRRDGMRHSAVTAIAPAREGSALIGVTPSVEPASSALFVQGLGGKRGAWNRHLLEDLRRLSLWDDAMLEELREDGRSIQKAARIPESLLNIYLTSFEIEPRWLVECAARRQKWIDLGQALTLYAPDSRMETVSEIYLLAWEMGLKSTNCLCVPEPLPRAAVKIPRKPPAARPAPAAVIA